MSEVVRRPTFLVLGAAKSGTTSLCDRIAQHPNVFFSTPKEPVFFELEYDLGLEYYWKRYFKDWAGQDAVGEGRVYNLYLPYVPARIRESIPDARLIVILRNPVDRAYSHWWHRVTRGYEQRSFEQAVEEEFRIHEEGGGFASNGDSEAWRRNFYPNSAHMYTADLRRVYYVEMGYYVQQLRRYYDLFPASRIKVLLFDDFVANPDPAAQMIYKFLNLRPFAGGSDTGPQNVALNTVKGRLAFRLERIGWRTGLGTVVPKNIRTRIRKLLSRNQGQRPPMDKHIEQRLKAHYAPSNAELQRLIGRGLSTWSAQR